MGIMLWSSFRFANHLVLIACSISKEKWATPKEVTISRLIYLIHTFFLFFFPEITWHKDSVSIVMDKYLMAWHITWHACHHVNAWGKKARKRRWCTLSVSLLAWVHGIPVHCTCGFKMLSYVILTSSNTQHVAIDNQPFWNFGTTTASPTVHNILLCGHARRQECDSMAWNGWRKHVRKRRYHILSVIALAWARAIPTYCTNAFVPPHSQTIHHSTDINGQQLWNFEMATASPSIYSTM